MSEDFDGPAQIKPEMADYVQVIANGKDDWSVPKEIKDPYENPKDRVGSKKLPYWVVPQTAIMHLTMGMRDGGYKYGPFNFRETRVVAEIYLDAARRHLTMWEAGEEYADDSNVHHLGHAMACLAILIDTMEHGKLIDNRPKSPEVIALMKRLHTQIAEEKRDPDTGVRQP
jgi:hypothetical protein